ncbi:MAG: hypothetical protein K2G04_05330 [Oscillospiraceae bacterium]|nr:hypothetical protein [Oscillospiraceae bacterium]
MGGTDTILKIWENGGGYIGLEHRCPDKPFEYLIGMFTPDSTAVPDEFDCVDFSVMCLGIRWIYCKEDTVHNTSGCAAELPKQGIKLWKDNDGGV